jgi:hypothetical protein
MRLDLATALTADDVPLITAVGQYDLLELHRQLADRTLEHSMFVQAADLITKLSSLLDVFPGADPWTTTQVVRSVIAALRRPTGLSTMEETRRFEVASTHLDTIRIQRRLECPSTPRQG